MNKPMMQQWGYAQAVKEFGDTPKARVASDVFNIGVNYLHRMPVGFNMNDNFTEKLHNHITAECKKNPPKPYGFLPAIGITWLFWILLESLISWAVRRLMDAYVLNK